MHDQYSLLNNPFRWLTRRIGTGILRPCNVTCQPILRPVETEQAASLQKGSHEKELIRRTPKRVAANRPRPKTLAVGGQIWRYNFIFDA